VVYGAIYFDLRLLALHRGRKDSTAGSHSHLNVLAVYFILHVGFGAIYFGLKPALKRG
jgi:hypothetical protein